MGGSEPLVPRLARLVIGGHLVPGSTGVRVDGSGLFTAFCCVPVHESYRCIRAGYSRDLDVACGAHDMLALGLNDAPALNQAAHNYKIEVGLEMIAKCKCMKAWFEY